MSRAMSRAMRNDLININARSVIFSVFLCYCSFLGANLIGARVHTKLAQSISSQQ